MCKLLEMAQRMQREVRRIQSSSILYNNLFCIEDAVLVLNRVSSKEFSIIQRALHDDVLMSVARLFDPPNMRKFENLSIRRVLSYAADEGCIFDEHKIFVSSWEKDLNLEVWRNKLLAHNDMEFLMGGADKVASIAHGIDSDKIMDFLSQLMNLLDEIIQFQGGEKIFLDQNDDLGFDLLAKLRD